MSMNCAWVDVTVVDFATDFAMAGSSGGWRAAGRGGGSAALLQKSRRD
jgi:hypothetical protein